MVNLVKKQQQNSYNQYAQIAFKMPKQLNEIIKTLYRYIKISNKETGYLNDLN